MLGSAIFASIARRRIAAKMQTCLRNLTIQQDEFAAIV